MGLDQSTFGYLEPSDEQLEAMTLCRSAAAAYGAVIEERVPPGPDKTYLLRRLREVAMWVNVAITRHPDGSPRK